MDARDTERHQSLFDNLSHDDLRLCPIIRAKCCATSPNFAAGLVKHSQVQINVLLPDVLGRRGHLRRCRHLDLVDYALTKLRGNFAFDRLIATLCFSLVIKNQDELLDRLLRIVIDATAVLLGQ